MNWDYLQPVKIHFGKGRVKEIKEIARELGCERGLLVAGPFFFKSGLAEKVIKESEGMIVASFGDVSPNPDVVEVDACAEVIRQKNIGFVVALGGGSPMDCAKAAASVALTSDSIRKYHGTGVAMPEKHLPLIAVPTTAGTGSETTLAAVITDAETRHKYAINDFPLIPRYAVLDPKVTLSLPPFITATTGMDALTHAVEAYIGNSTTPGTRKNALDAVRLIFENLDTAYTHGNDIEARRNMLRASYFAGCAFTKSYVGYVHAIAHSLGGKYNVPHGLANAMILPMVLETYGDSITHKLRNLAVTAGLCDKHEDDKTAARMFIDAIKDMKKRFGIGDYIPEIQETDIPELAHYADKEANPLYPVPVLMDAGELETLYYRLMPPAGNC
mgnify:CR=1 FL=1